MYREEIKATFLKYVNLPFFESTALKAMAKRYPEGELAFWTKKRYEYIEKIKTKSVLLGQMWINSHCLDLTPMNDFISIIDNSLTDILSSQGFSLYSQDSKDKLAKTEIDTFFKLWLEYRAIEAIIDEFGKDDDNLTHLTYEKLFADNNECDRITRIIIKNACKDGIFTGFNEAKPATSANQLKIAYEIISEQYFKKPYIDTRKGLIEVAKQKFFKHFGWTGYRGKRPNKKNCVDITKSIKSGEIISNPNIKAIQEIELILSQK